ncbi:hypothetical protein [Morganella morganii]|uniref:hypothetical protein n=1 Tax=Morganella morganii TaxID=582 RepID=UPI001968676E|nr:hypothetical protein [Morganella morganii]
MMEYPRRIGKRAGSGGTYEENYQRALKSAIEQMDLQRRGKPTGEPSLSEQRVAETLHNICRITALRYPHYLSISKHHGKQLRHRCGENGKLNMEKLTVSAVLIITAVGVRNHAPARDWGINHV